MDEMRLIETYFAGRGIQRGDVLLGIGDDAAVTRFSAHDEQVIAADMLCAGTHFPADTPAHALGHRSLAVNLSDLAAMGAEPLWCTLALSLPSVDPDWLRQFADGFFSLAERFKVALIGGDTVRGPLAMTVSVHGRVAAGQAIRRDGARTGDRIYVTGHPGLAASGLQALQSGQHDEKAVECFLYPEPRVNEGRALAGLATAMIDLSDGLAVDIERMLKASGVGAELDVSPLESDVSPGVLLHGGDDYELGFCVPADQADALQELTLTWAVPVTCIGTVVQSADVTWRANGQPCDTDSRPFEHFS